MISTSSATPKPAILHEVFDALNLPQAERFEVWRHSVLPLFEPKLPQTSSQEFFARVDGYNLRRLFFCLCDFSAQGYLRERRHRAAESVDHLLIQLYLAGGYVGHNGQRAMRVEAGDISLLDLGYPLQTSAEASSTLSLVVPRDLMISLVGTAPLQPGRILSASSTLGGILGQHMKSVWRALRNASAEEGEGISQMLLGAVAGAFGGYGPADVFAPELERATLDAICEYIERNLASPELSPEHLCRRFRSSPIQLDRLFHPLGGVSSYLQTARLRRCLRELTDHRVAPGPIADVARRWGFTRCSHFAKLFREQFGITPEQAVERGQARRAGGSPGERSALPNRPAFHDWLCGL